MTLHALKPNSSAVYNRNIAVARAEGARRDSRVASVAGGLPPPANRSRIPAERVIEGEVLKQVFESGQGASDQFTSRLWLFSSTVQHHKHQGAAIAAYQDNRRLAAAREAAGGQAVNVFV